jgi:hypothetical protein
MRRFSAVAVSVTGVLIAAVLLATPVQAAASTVASVAAALRTNPVYVDPATQSGTLTADAARLTPAVPAGVHLAVLPRSVIPAGADATELPALISAGIGQGGTFVILLDGRLYGASTTIPGQLNDDLATTQAALPKSGDATPALIALARSLDGPGDLQDNTSPSRAGGPIGVALLIVIAGVLLIGGLSLWWWLRRKPKARRRRRVEPLRDLVEIDYDGNVVNRTPANERQQ